MERADVYRFIAERKLAVLATMHSAQSPQSALIGIAITPDLEIVFDTVNTSRKYPNLISNPACSLVIGWEGEMTVQYEGIAQEISGAELVPYQKVYFETWPDGITHQTWPGLVYFVVRPRWIRYSDYDQRPPLIQEFTFEGK